MRIILKITKPLSASFITSLILVSPLFADFSGRVVSILDGDTIEVLNNQQPDRVRLNGIDCPEKGQAFGKRAKQATSELVFGKDVMLKTHGKDRHGRTIADVLLSDGTNVNHMLVKDGWCWWYRKYAPKSVILEELERQARAAGLGLWAEPNPVPPWIYRKAGRRTRALSFSETSLSSPDSVDRRRGSSSGRAHDPLTEKRSHHMKYLAGFVLGLIVATAGQLLAQSGGMYMDENARLGSFFSYPGGATQYTTPDGKFGTIYSVPGSEYGVTKNPC